MVLSPMAVLFLSLMVLCSGSGFVGLHTKGTTLAIGDDSYFISADLAGQLPDGCDFSAMSPLNSNAGLLAATVFDVPQNQPFGRDQIESSVASYLQEDDVFNESFLSAIIIQTGDRMGVYNVSGQQSTQSSVIITCPSSAGLQPGPYVISPQDGAWYIPYLLYADTQGAFPQGVVPRAEGGFQSLSGAIAASSSMTIAVPSRLYYTRTAEKPLAGVRLGVKDIYDLQGVKTGAGSRAYDDLYPEANTTAPAVQRLIDAGAVVVGKMKTTQFAAPEFVSLATDYQSPFNGRADGYQEPGSSSSGPGAGMSSYDWLDIALGSDTGGSVRVPAYENGLFGNRPSHGYAPLDHVVPLGPAFDTAGLLARDPLLWSEAARALYSGLNANHTAYPRKIQTFGLSAPASQASSPTPADKVVQDFIQKLADFLFANVTQLNYTQRWAETHPDGTGADLTTYLNTTWEALTAAPQADLVRKPFFADYAAKYNGRQPYVNPSARTAWDWALSENPSVDDASVQKSAFMAWWNTHVLTPDPESCSDSLVLYAGKNALGVAGEPSYRDTQIPGIGIVTGLLGGLFISPLAEVPDFVVPLGEVPYNSTVTGREEVLPVTIDIMAAKGCDFMLFDLINELHQRGILPSLKAGTSMLQGGPVYL